MKSELPLYKSELTIFESGISMYDIINNHIEGVTSYLITEEDDKILYKQWLELHQYIPRNEKEYDYFNKFQKYYKIYVKGRFEYLYANF